MSTPAPGPELRDIHLPPAPGWWPPAPGWWLLAVLAAALLAWLGMVLHRRMQRRRRCRRILRELEHSITPARGHPGELATVLSRFLRRLARSAQPDAVTLAGERWLEFLDRCAGSDEFTHGVGRALVEAPYRRAADYDGAALVALVRRCARRMLDAERARA